MKTRYYLLFTILLSSLILMGGSCDDDSPTNSTNGIVKQISSATGGTVGTETGTEIIVPAGSILDNTAGTAGNISFSIESNVKDLPAPIPSGYTVIGGVTLFGPANFIFVEPIRLWLGASTLEDLEGISVLKYSENESKWISYPISDVDAENKRIGVSSFELGFFAVVKSQTAASKVPAALALNKSGGIKYEHQSMSNYYFTLMVKGFTAKYPAEQGMVSIGSNTSTGSQTTSGPLTKTYMGGIPQGNYSILVSRVRAGTLFNLPGQREYYSVYAPVVVGPYGMTSSWDWYNWTGWTNLILPAGTWTTTPPSMWPAPTKPFGTGDFQATLSWINTDVNGTDLDLHIYGPNDLHVYFGDEKSDDGSLELDLDWMSENGSATENIYSLKSMPSGEYSVYVNAFGGDFPKQFDVRIIRRGTTVKTFRGSATSENMVGGKTGMILIQKFRI